VRRRRVAVVTLLALPVALLAARAADGAAAGPNLVAAGTVLVSSSTTTAAATGLDPGLVDAFDRARAAAAGAGHALTVTSGFRSAEEQAALLDAEIAERGSREEALWWVFPPERSMHVQGLAVDVGDGPAADWLAARGAAFGLCRTLAWEWWHFEWRDRWESSATCPAPAATPADAPPR
jgi:LAS superfamily LD-carboxypeptidase LdcB